MRKSLYVGCLAAGLLVTGCGDTVGETECTPADVRLCDCSDGPGVIEICGFDDGEWKGCDCPGPPVNGVPVTVGALVWETSLGPVADFPTAQATCAAMDNGSGMWRLPTNEDWQTILTDCLPHGSHILCGGCGEAAFCNAVIPTYYWSATPVDGPDEKHYVARAASTAYLLPVPDTYPLPALCVRDASSL